MENTEVFDIPQLRARLQLLIGNSSFYPAQLETLYPRIINQVVTLWGSTELDAYLNGLMVTERTDRHGFPEDVASEILHLARIHWALGLSRDTSGIGWAAAFDAQLDERAKPTEDLAWPQANLG